MPQDENITKDPEISEELKSEEISGEQEIALAEPAVEPIPEIPEPAKPAEQPTQTEQTETPALAEQEREETLAVEPPVEQIPPEPQQPVVDDLTPDLAAEPPSEIAEPSADSRPAPVMADKQPQVIEKIIYQTPPNFIQNLLIKARAKIQERKRKKLDKIMALFETKQQITNKDVQKLLWTTKRTARRYFDKLEKEGKIIQVGDVGRGVLYIKKP